MWIYTNLTPNTYKILAPGQFLSKLFSYRCLKITCLHIECPQTGQWSLQVFISSATQETSGLTNQVTTFLAVHIYLPPWESPMILLMAAGLCLVRFHWPEGFFSAQDYYLFIPRSLSAGKVWVPPHFGRQFVMEVCENDCVCCLCLGRWESPIEAGVKTWEIREVNSGRDLSMEGREPSRRKRSIFKGPEEG